MKTQEKNQVKVTVDFESKMITTHGMIHSMKGIVDGTITFEEAGITELDKDSIVEHFEDKAEEECYEVQVEFETPNFYRSVKVSVYIQDLADLGWELSDELDSQDNYHIDITVDDEGKTSWCLTNTEKMRNRIWEGSDKEATGDDEQTIKDLYVLYSKGSLFNIETECYGL